MSDQLGTKGFGVFVVDDNMRLLRTTIGKATAVRFVNRRVEKTGNHYAIVPVVTITLTELATRDAAMIKAAEARGAVEYDHLKTKGSGGPDTKENLRQRCHDCHDGRHKANKPEHWKLTA